MCYYGKVKRYEERIIVVVRHPFARGALAACLALVAGCGYARAQNAARYCEPSKAVKKDLGEAAEVGWGRADLQASSGASPGRAAGTDAEAPR